MSNAEYEMPHPTEHPLFGAPCPTCATGTVGQSGTFLRCANCGWLKCDLRIPTRRPVMNSPATAEARDRANTAPPQADPDARCRGETGTSSGSEARPVTATAHPSSPLPHDSAHMEAAAKLLGATPPAAEQQPAARHCCRKHEAEDLRGNIFGRNFIVCPTCRDKRCPHADDCANACSQQPAQPGSGEVLAQLRKLEKAVDSGKHYGFQQDIWTVAANEIDRLQSALTAAQQRIADLESELETERAWGIHTCHDQCQRPLCVAQRRVARLEELLSGERASGECGDMALDLLKGRLAHVEKENADLRNRLNLSEKRQGRFPQDATQPKDPT